MAAAIEVLDEAGVVGLSMRRVADRLGTGAASLYAHVTGKDELLELVFDELVGQVPLPEPDPRIWREQVRQMARDLRADPDRPPRRRARRAWTYPHESEDAGRRRDARRDAASGGPVRSRDRARSRSAHPVRVGGRIRDGADGARRDHPEDVQRYYDDVHAFYMRLPADRFPVLASVVDDITGPDGDERFEFGLDRADRRPRGRERRYELMPSALGGLKVLDFSRVLAGPLATMMLADLGAVVTKVEPPAGDDTRQWGPPYDEAGDATYFQAVNRNKHSLVLDLTDPADLARAQEARERGGRARGELPSRGDRAVRAGLRVAARGEPRPDLLLDHRLRRRQGRGAPRL